VRVYHRAGDHAYGVVTAAHRVWILLLQSLWRVLRAIHHGGPIAGVLRLAREVSGLTSAVAAQLEDLVAHLLPEGPLADVGAALWNPLRLIRDL
jgi:hypothetical protein